MAGGAGSDDTTDTTTRESSMKVRIDTDRCSGHARCAANGPDVFELDDDGYALPLDGGIPAHLEAQARAGADACPERAIEIIE